MKKTDLGALRLLLHSGIDVMTQMPLASEYLKRLVPSFSLSMIRVNEDCAPQEHYSEFFDEFSHGLFASSGHQFSANTDDPAAFGNLLRDKVPYGTLIEGRPEFIAGATYQHLFQRNGIHHVLDVALRSAEGPLAILGIFREKAAPAFSRADVYAVSQIYDSLVHSFSAPPLPADFEEADSAVLLTSTTGVIEWATPSARAWLEDAHGGLERARLMGENLLPEACRELTRKLAAQEAPTLSLPIPGGRVRLRAYGLAPLSPSEVKRKIAISIHLEVHRGLKVHRALDRTPLTLQQKRIAFGYWSGKKPQAICEELELSASTLKSYQKDLYARLDVNSVAELVQALEAQAQSAGFDLERHLPRRQDKKTPPTPARG